MQFRDVYAAHFDFVWRSLRRLGVPEADAADALQEVFLVVHRRLSEFEGHAKLTTWLFRICMNVARAKQRVTQRRKEVLDDELHMQADSSMDPSQTAMERQGLAFLERALSEMPMEQRAVFTLFELEQVTCQEIADALRIPLGTVYSRLRLARESFQRTVRHLGTSKPMMVQGGSR